MVAIDHMNLFMVLLHFMGASSRIPQLHPGTADDGTWQGQFRKASRTKSREATVGMNQR